MVTFCLLVAPLPFTFKKKLFTFLSTSPIIAKVAYGLKISFMYAQLSMRIVVQFIDQSLSDSSPFSSSTRSKGCSEWPQRLILQSKGRAVLYRTSEQIPTSLLGSSSTS